MGFEQRILEQFSDEVLERELERRRHARSEREKREKEERERRIAAEERAREKMAASHDGATRKRSVTVGLSREVAQLFGVSERADFDEVRRAYRRLMREHHPDRVAGDKKAEAIASEMCSRLNQAMSELNRRVR